jgi:hypothetical protein
MAKVKGGTSRGTRDRRTVNRCRDSWVTFWLVRRWKMRYNREWGMSWATNRHIGGFLRRSLRI